MLKVMFISSEVLDPPPLDMPRPSQEWPLSGLPADSFSESSSALLCLEGNAIGWSFHKGKQVRFMAFYL